MARKETSCSYGGILKWHNGLHVPKHRERQLNLVDAFRTPRTPKNPVSIPTHLRARKVGETMELRLNCSFALGTSTEALLKTEN